MELMIFSDSHGKNDGMQRALSLQPHAPGAVCFLGDGLRGAEELDIGRAMLYSVRGNCDWSESETPTERLVSIEGHSILLTHGHLFGVKGGYGALLSHGVARGADILLFGHTHRPYEECIPIGTRIGETVLSRPVHLFNPGSIGYDEDGNGRSFGTLLLRGESVLFSHGRIKG